MEQLYINNQPVQLKKNAVTQTFQINDLGDAKNRQGNYSNNIKIPKTTSNLKSFELLGLFGSSSKLPYERVDVKYLVNGIEVISEGKGVIKETNSEYSMVVYSGSVDMPDVFADKTLLSIDFSDIDHDLDIDEFISSQDNTDGYIYSLANYSDSKVNTNYVVSEMTPSLFIHDIWDRIFDRAGYTYSGDVFSTEDFRSRLMAVSKGYNRNVEEIITQVLDVDSFQSIDENGTTSEFYFEELGTRTANKDGVLEITGSVVLTNIIASTIGIQVQKNGFAMEGFSPVEFFENQIPETASISMNSRVNINQGDVVSVVVTGVSSPQNIDDYSFKVNVDSDFQYKQVAQSIPVKINDLIGDLPQIDFIKDVMQRFGLVFRKTRNQKNYDFIRMEDLFNSRDSAIDWSDKLTTSTPKESYDSGYAQSNYFRYTYNNEDDTRANNFGDGVIEVENYNADNRKEVVRSAFYATQTINGNCRLNHWTLEEIDGVDVLQPNEDNYRCFKNNYAANSISYTFLDSTISFISFSGQTSTLDFNAINYQNELTRNYSLFSGVIQSYNKKTVELNLNALDIYNLDFFKLYYFKQFGNYYYLNKVSNYRDRRITKVELIKVDGTRGFINGSIIAEAWGRGFGSCRSSVLKDILLKSSSEIKTEAYGILNKVGIISLVSHSSILSDAFGKIGLSVYFEIMGRAFFNAVSSSVFELESYKQTINIGRAYFDSLSIPKFELDSYIAYATMGRAFFNGVSSPKFELDKYQEYIEMSRAYFNSVSSPEFDLESYIAYSTMGRAFFNGVSELELELDSFRDYVELGRVFFNGVSDPEFDLDSYIEFIELGRIFFNAVSEPEFELKSIAPTTFTPVSVFNFGANTHASACFQSVTNDTWYISSTETVSVGTSVYYSENISDSVVGNNLYYMNNDGLKATIKINNSGVITQFTPC